MSRYEEFRRRILERAAELNRRRFSVTTRGLANNHGIPESHIREELFRLAELGLISLFAWDGERERPYNEWPDKAALFANTTDKGHVSIRLLSAGGELLSKDPTFG